MKDLERKYDARISEVFRSDIPGAGGQTGPEGEFEYSAFACDTDDVVVMTKVKPFRRLLFATGTETPEVVSASVGDDCEIAICQGKARLVNVPEQYLVGDCDTP